VDIELDLEREEEVFGFLEMLKDSSHVNMLGATPYMQEHLEMNYRVARKWMLRWIDTPTRITKADTLLKGE